jgi:hypothetical protein
MDKSCVISLEAGLQTRSAERSCNSVDAGGDRVKRRKATACPEFIEGPGAFKRARSALSTLPTLTRNVSQKIHPLLREQRHGFPE